MGNRSEDMESRVSWVGTWGTLVAWGWVELALLGVDWGFVLEACFWDRLDFWLFITRWYRSDLRISSGISGRVDMSLLYYDCRVWTMKDFYC